MAAVIIRKKDVERLGRKLLKEVYDFLHDEYILTNFEEIKEEQKRFLRNLVLFKFRSLNFTTTQKENSWSIKYEEFDENKFENKIKSLKEQIQNGNIDTEIIFKTLNHLFLDPEIDGDLFFKTKAFLNLINVINCDYRYLED